jgi:rubrerythrin
MSTDNSLEQAIRNAITAEGASARYYITLSERAADDSTRRLFLTMAQQEREHQKQIQAVGARLGAGELPELADANFERVEMVPGWEGRESIRCGEALELALSAEHNAAMIYETIAEMSEGAVAELFDGLARTEEQHARNLQLLLDGDATLHFESDVIELSDADVETLT